MCLNDIELFEMKNFLIYSEQARSEANYVNGQTKMTGLDYMDLEEALDILDPDGRRIPSFYIYEAYSEKLDDIRKRKRELEKSMEIAAEDTKKEYQNLRHQVVLEEEEEEQIIREQLTKRLQPYLDAMLYNANVTGRMDLLLEKLTATYFGKAVKPVFSQMAGVRKDPVHKDAENDSNHAADISVSYTHLDVYKRQARRGQ